MASFVIRSRKVVLTSAAPVEAAISVRDGRIESIATGAELPRGPGVVDCGDSVIMPGLVDTHAHINEPGRTEWEGFETATRAAAAGGITTVIDMPLNSIPPTTTLENLNAKARAAEGKCRIDYGFWGGVVPGNAGDLPAMIEAGAIGFKAFLCPSGVDEFPMAREADLRAAMPVLARAGVPLLVHAELEAPLAGPSAGAAGAGDPRRYRTYLDSRPRDWENRAVRFMIGLCEEYRGPVHIVHLSSAEALADLRAARARGVPITAETCPHYLVFTAEEIADGATHFKCAPPIREAENRERLWAALAAGDLEFIVSDHSPCTPGLKLLEQGDFCRAWGGISSLQFTLPVIWTELSRRGHSLAELTRWMCGSPARFAGLGARKGAIAPGMDADLVVWNPERAFRLEAGMVRHRHPLTPYAGRELRGTVEATYLRGEKIFDRGEFPGPARGRRLSRLEKR